MIENKILKVILISGLPGIGTNKIVEQIFALFPKRNFISSCSVVYRLPPSEKNKEIFLKEIEEAKRKNCTLIVSPDLCEVPFFAEQFRLEIISFFFTSATYIPFESNFKIEVEWQRGALNRYLPQFNKVFEVDSSLLFKKEIELKEFAKQIAAFIQEAETV